MIEYSTEIRKLRPGDVFELIQILEYADSWKRLMAIIPKTLSLNNYECNIEANNLPKYSTDHLKLIENASYKQRRPSTEILFEEWGTSGRVRPSVGHLYNLLIKAELYRAADYVALKLLKIPPPERPATGPAALIVTSENETVERILDDMSYPSSISSPDSSTILYNNLDRTVPYKPVIPKIIVTETQSNEVSGDVNNISSDINNVSVSDENNEIETQTTDISNGSSTVSDMMKFSQSQNEIPALSTLLSSQSQSGNLPALSTLLSENQSGEITQGGFVPAFSDLIPQEKVSPVSEEQSNGISSGNIPAFSAILGANGEESRQRNEIPDLNVLQPSDECISINGMPHLSTLLPNGNSDTMNSKQFIPVIDINLSGSGSLPDFNSQYHNEKSSNSGSTLRNSTSPVNTASNCTRTTCISPLPNLSLDTVLPHYTYDELHKATNDFDETICENSCSDQTLTEDSGRKLGSGAYGSVYLAIGLLNRPVAVKKLHLNFESLINIDAVTKQFKNEVELLCKYRHENLLSLLGYSCDGPTYCLLYEYIPGGSLKDRLQKRDDCLVWTDRLYVALGTARAVSYLHTAYSTPLIHRDIKSANILLDCSNKPKLCDFGLIKLCPKPNTNTGTTGYSTSAFGTSAYMAPEAFRGDVSVKSDTFSFGVVLLELLTGLPPLDETRDGYDLVTHVEGHCDEDITPLLDLKGGNWMLRITNFGNELFKITKLCLEEKKHRLNMEEAVKKLTELIDKT